MSESIRIGLLGCGTVGTGVLRILRENAADIQARLSVPIEVCAIAVRSADKGRDPVVDRSLLVTDPSAVITDPTIQVVVELMGGYEPARELLIGALEHRKHVVTANKALLARHGTEIFRKADEVHRDVIFEASVGYFGAPFIIEGLAGDGIWHMIYQAKDAEDRLSFILLESTDLIRWR